MQVERDRLGVRRHFPALRKFTLGPGRIVLSRPLRAWAGFIGHKAIVDVQAHAPRRALCTDTNGIERRRVVGPCDPERTPAALRERGMADVYRCGYDCGREDRAAEITAGLHVPLPCVHWTFESGSAPRCGPVPS